MDVKNEIERLYGHQIPPHSNNLELWLKWYRGFDDKFHTYNIPLGVGKSKEVTRLSMKMGKSVAENYANLLINEKTDVVLPNEHDNELLKKIYDRLGFWNRTNVGVEEEYALGSGAGVISFDRKIDKNTGNNIEDGDWKIHYEFLDATKVYPLNWRYGECIECAFVSLGTYEGHIVLHVLNEKGNYVIYDYRYIKENINGEWQLAREQLSPIDTKSNVKLFSYVKPNINNNQCIGSDIGISIFANSIDTMKSIDTIYDAYYYEFVLGKKRVFASAEMNSVDKNGNVYDTFDPNDIGVYVLPIDDDGKQKLNFVDGQLRAESYSRALNDYLSMLSYQVGFGKNFFSFGGEGGRPIQTATAIIAQNSDLFRNIKKQEIYIDKFITEITKAVVFSSTKYTQDKFNKQYEEDEILIQFDDSIFEDKESQKETDRKDVNLGIMSKIEYRAKWNAEDEDTAKKKLNENIDYLINNINLLLPALQSKAITPEMFVNLIYGESVENKQQLIDYITENVNAQAIDEASFKEMLTQV